MNFKNYISNKICITLYNKLCGASKKYRQKHIIQVAVKIRMGWNGSFLYVSNYKLYKKHKIRLIFIRKHAHSDLISDFGSIVLQQVLQH